jgi:hypothetical protein
MFNQIHLFSGAGVSFGVTGFHVQSNEPYGFIKREEILITQAILAFK